MNTNIRRIYIAAWMSLAITGGATAGMATATAEPTTVGEVTYLAVIESYDIPYSNEDAAIRVGYAICDGFRQGMTLNTVIRAGVTGSEGYYDQTDVARIAGAASGALCPGVKVRGLDY